MTSEPEQRRAILRRASGESKVSRRESALGAACSLGWFCEEGLQWQYVSVPGVPSQRTSEPEHCRAILRGRRESGRALGASREYKVGLEP